MSDPKRWRDGGEAPGGVSDLLKHARRSRPMTSSERERVTLRVDRIAALPVAIGLGLWLKGIAIAAGLATTAVVVTRGPALWSEPPAPAVATSAAASGARRAGPVNGSDEAAPSGPSETEANAEALTEAPADALEPPSTAEPSIGAVSSSARAVAPSPSASGEADAKTPLAREVELLEEAGALLGSRPSEALVRLEQHAARFPRGKMTWERELLILDALSRLGRTAEARRRGEALLARSSGGLYKDRIRSLLDSLP